MIFRIFTLLILLFTSGFAHTQDQVKVLFIGNSLTYYNNLPALVEQAAAENGVQVEATMIAKPNYAIIDHLDDGEIQSLITNGNFDYVIVQQGPSSQPEGRKMLVEDGRKLAELCQQEGTQLCFFMVWPSLNYYSTFDGVIESYTLAAKASNALLLPVGTAWKEYIAETKNYQYYSPDGFHPSLRGSQVAASIIIEILFN